MFQDCNALTTIDISKWDLSNVTSVYGIFYNCYALTSVAGLSKLVSNKVTNIDSIFSGCKSLTSVEGISEWDTSAVTDIAWIFNGCSSLTTIDISGWDASSVLNAGNIFTDCTGLTDIWFGRMVITTGAYIGFSNVPETCVIHAPDQETIDYIKKDSSAGNFTYEIYSAA
jgi:surface protein